MTATLKPRRKSRLVCGVGINDADYPVAWTVAGVKTVCPIYKIWKSLLRRLYDEKWLTLNPTYLECSICEEWLSFSNFRSWVLTQEYSGLVLDKDLLVKGNKHYSPPTCIFVPVIVNAFMTEVQSTNSGLPIGVFKNRNLYRAQCSNPFGGRIKSIGFLTIEEAAKEYRRMKLEFAIELAKSQSNPVIRDALIERYS